jgi:hypothetical protein
MQTKKRRLSYRLDLLPVIYPFHRRSENELGQGDLVYYGPTPEYYGIGEVVAIEDVFLAKYLIPIHQLNLSHLLKER